MRPRFSTAQAEVLALEGVVDFAVSEEVDDVLVELALSLPEESPALAAALTPSDLRASALRESVA